MKSDSAAFVKLTFRDYVGLVRLLGGGKHAKVPLLPAEGNVRHPLVGNVVPVSAKQPGRLVICAGLSHVLLVDGLGYISQLANAVVSGVAVNVVNLPIRPSPVKMQPSKAVRAVTAPINHDDRVSVRAASRNSSRFCRPATEYAPNENAGFGVVVKNFAQTLRGKIGLSHDAPSKRIGQRPVSVSSTCGLRHFSVGGA